MGNWLGRWLGTSGAARETAPARDAAARHAPTPQSPVTAWRPALDVDLAFFRWLLDQPQETAATSPTAELAYLDELAHHAAEGATALVPRVPAVVPQLLHTLRDPSRPTSVLARQLAQDPVLVAGVLKLARSPFYGLQAPVTSLEQALLVIGQDGLRQMLASVAFKPIINLQSGVFTRRGAPRVWDQSERCGLACHVIGPAAGASAFEAFLAALLQSVGRVVVLRLLDQHPPAALCASTHACGILLGHARRIACAVGRQWTFPDAVIGAVAERDPAHRAPGHTVLGQVLRVSSELSALRVLADANIIASDDARLDLAGHPPLQRCFQMLNAAAD
jgi:HD-like signal output (HDOD) protein